MITKQEVEKQFLTDLAELLKKWSIPTWTAEISLEDASIGWERDQTIMISIPSLYDADLNCLREYVEFELLSRFSAEDAPK